jgi:hypothetical protein
VWIDSFVLVKVGHWEFPILIGHNQIKENSMILEFRVVWAAASYESHFQVGITTQSFFFAQ